MEEQPTLVFGDCSIPLIKISKNQFRFRKNSEALGAILGGQNSDGLRYTRETHTIESFCLVATVEVKIEASILLYSLRQHHSQPVYVLTDTETKKYLDRFNFGDVHYILAAEKSDLKTASEVVGDKFNHINTFHRAECILKKMEAMEIALSQHGNTFFLDSDIIILGNLQENFCADLCLSPHFNQDPLADEISGKFNAGYIFCANKGFPAWWRDQFLNSGTFYEQECLNRADLFFDTQAFNSRHNAGFWRGEVDFSELKSAHIHLSNSVESKMMGDVKRRHSLLKNKFLEYLNDVGGYEFILNEANKESLRGRKLAFVHFGKAGGVYTGHYLRTRVFDNLEYKNQWRDQHDGNMDGARDWNAGELYSFLGGDWDNILVHNHHNNWSGEILREYRANGWFTFSFLRHPCDLLCSLYFFSRKNIEKTGISAINPEGVLAGYLASETFRELDVTKISLDKFIRAMVEDRDQWVFWVPPNWMDELDFVGELSQEDMARFYRQYFGHRYIPGKKINTSGNLGYHHYLKTGEISSDTYAILMGSDGAERYRKLGILV